VRNPKGNSVPMPNQWKEISNLYHDALKRPESERNAFLKTCGASDDVRREVASLLTNESDGDLLLQSPALEVAAKMMAKSNSIFTIGQTLAHFQIINRLGEGGMGEVYRAKDQKLGRDVAIKVLPGEFASDPNRVARFQREATLLAALNHTNIAAIHGLEEYEGTGFLVLEFVEGETLADRLKRGPIPIEETLKLASQLTEALEAAHEKGVIHRDLKPANIKVTPEGKVKVLDFGLAKAFSADINGVDPPQSPMITGTMTHPGIVLGTPAYMSPEQAKGMAVDKRTDIWAFGCVLYECLTGKRAFEGETVTETLAAILKGEPDWDALPKATPPKIRALLMRCLQKDMARRLHDAADARFEIEEAAVPPPQAVRSPRNRARLAWALAALFLIAAVALAVIHFGEVSPLPPVISFTISPPNDAVFAHAYQAPRMALSPDGRFLAFTASMRGKADQLWVRRLDSSEPRVLNGTEGAQMPFWSPDSRFIGFFADRFLKRTEVSGGAVQTLCPAASGATGTWNRNGVIVFGGYHEPLRRISPEGGFLMPVTTLDPSRPQSHIYPQFLPDGRHFMFMSETESTEKPRERAVYVGSLDSDQTKLVFRSGSMASYAPSGHLLYVRQGTLVAHPFDLKKLRLTGSAQPLIESVILAANGRAAFTFSETNILAYRTNCSSSSQLVWLDRNGKQIGKVGDSAEQSSLELSSEGKRALVSITDRAKTDQTNDAIWLWDVERGLRTRLTFSLPAFNSIWSPDGKSVVFNSYSGGVLNLFRKASTGTGTEELVFQDTISKYPNSWSPDGKFILFSAWDPKTLYDLYVLPLSGDRKAIPILNTPFMEAAGQFSPDGRWIAYVSNESGNYQVYVTPFPKSGGKWLISPDTGYQPRWGRNGNEIFYIDPAHHKLMSASVDGRSADFKVNDVKPLFDVRAGEVFNPSSYSGYSYDVSADGRRFLANIPVEPTASTPITVVLNWTSLLKK
jgi:eukaryotic-like serine/threonine-protein kinase